MIYYREDKCRRENKQKILQFQWIIDFLWHFFDTHKEMSKDTKEQLIHLILDIKEKYAQNEFEIGQITKYAVDGANQCDEESFPNHFKVVKFFLKDGFCVKMKLEKNGVTQRNV